MLKQIIYNKEFWFIEEEEQKRFISKYGEGCYIKLFRYVIKKRLTDWEISKLLRKKDMYIDHTTVNYWRQIIFKK
jgi:hypothetical protein